MTDVPAETPKPAPPTKFCTDCNDYKPLDAFFKNRNTTDGYAQYCKIHSMARVRAVRTNKRAAKEAAGREASAAPHVFDENGNIRKFKSAAAQIEAMLSHINLPPMFLNDGSINWEFFQACYGAIAASGLACAMQGKPVPFNTESLIKLVDRWVESYGGVPKRLQDHRTESEKASDALAKLHATPPETCAIIDDELDALENLNNTSEVGCRHYYEDKAAAIEEKFDAKKKWMERLAKLRYLRDAARLAIHDPTHILNKTDEIAQAAAHPIRFMGWVGRSNMDQGKRFAKKTGLPSEAIFQAPAHVCKLVCDIHLARYGIDYWWDDTDTLTWIPGQTPYEGIVVLMPVGHSKSEVVCHYAALEVCKDPERVQGAMIHAVIEKAIQNLQYVETCFDMETAQGRRCRALFPKVEVAVATQKQMRVKTRNVLKSPTLSASGVTASALGGNTSIIFGDDIVPQSDADEPTERNRRSDLVAGTWMTRQRGQRFFSIFVGTPWHHDDALMRMARKARRWHETDGREGVCYALCVQRCGGPKSSQKFKPLWPEGCPAQKLRSFYQQLGPRLYSSAYMMNPLADDRRIVKKLRLYDPSEPEHAQFVENSRKYLSLDPAATRGERSDLAGAIYAGMGTMRMEREEDGRKVVKSENRLRILAAEEFPSTQWELAQKVHDFVTVQPVDYVIAEVRSGFRGFGEILENAFGIEPIRLDPGNKKKEERLRAAAPALEDGNSDIGIRAVVEFPGVRGPDGELVLDERFDQLASQILDFGATDKDASLDCLTQMVIYLSPDLGIGSGAVTMTVKLLESKTKDPRMLEMWKKWQGTDTSKPVEQEEAEWCRRQWSVV